MNYDATFEDCYVKFESNILTIGNDSIERSWVLNNPVPEVLSLKNKKTGREWFVEGRYLSDEGNILPKDAFVKQGIISGDRKDCSIASEIDDDLGTGARHLKIRVKLEYETIILIWTHIIYPGIAIIRTFIECVNDDSNESGTGEIYTTETGNAAEGLLVADGLTDQADYQFTNKEIDVEVQNSEDDFLDCLPVNSLHCRWKAIRLIDDTDYYNNLVKTEEGTFYYTEINKIKGNLLFINDQFTDEGFLLVKEGPTPLAYQGGTVNDFTINFNNILIKGWGFTPGQLNKYSKLQSYGSAIVLCDSATIGDTCESAEFSALEALHTYNNAVHRFNPDKDAFVMSNTWGDRSKDGRINCSFVLDELATAKRLGISLLQVDDGWQNGITANSTISGGVWEGYYDNNPDFWEINDRRFPDGFDPVVRSAKEKGISLGMWFSPDSTNDFHNWESDAAVLIKLHQQYGIISFKLDGVKIRSKKGEENLFSMLHKVVRETEGKVFFNYDVTAEVRNGYYGRTQYSCIFLENRYTDWVNYYPHWTLRNLWMLSKYFPSYRLQIEFLNVRRNAALYGEDVLAPAKCGIEYSFAVTMFANPLAWMELSELDEESLQALEGIIPVYRKYQADILGGHVLPIGDEPNGFSWTGFQSITDIGTGYLLIIKEHNEKKSERIKLWGIRSASLSLGKLAGYGDNTEVLVDEAGKACFEMEGKFRFTLYKYKAH